MRLALLFLCAALSACGRSGPAVDPRAVLTRAQLDTVATPLLLAALPEREVYATLVPHGDNETVTTWRTADQVAMAFDAGVLVGTRGLGDDLMGADVAGTKRLLAGDNPGGVYSRLNSYLDGENQTVFRGLRCRAGSVTRKTLEIVELRIETRRIEETCHATGLTIRNRYWVGADGVLWKSRQWVSPGVGYVDTERLVR